MGARSSARWTAWREARRELEQRGLVGMSAADRPVLITGGAGFIGSNLADRLASDGERARVRQSWRARAWSENLALAAARHPHRIAVASPTCAIGRAVADAARDAPRRCFISPRRSR